MQASVSGTATLPPCLHRTAHAARRTPAPPAALRRSTAASPAPPQALHALHMRHARTFPAAPRRAACARHTKLRVSASDTPRTPLPLEAEAAYDPQNDPSYRMNVQAIFDFCDIDGDGTLNEEEYRVLVIETSTLREVFDISDGNIDAFLELAMSACADMQGPCPQGFDDVGINVEGLSYGYGVAGGVGLAPFVIEANNEGLGRFTQPGELTAASPPFEGEPQECRQKMVKAMFDFYDKDKDGILSEGDFIDFLIDATTLKDVFKAEWDGVPCDSANAYFGVMFNIINSMRSEYPDRFPEDGLSFQGFCMLFVGLEDDGQDSQDVDIAFWLVEAQNPALAG